LGQARETLTVLLTDSVDLRHSANPTNDSERLVFRELFETLIRIDCRGEVRPGLAQTWEQDGSHRIWTFRLREETAQTGVPSAAADVVSSWRARPDAMAGTGIESAEALGDGRVMVRFNNPQDSVPRVLADPMLAVAHGGGSILNRADRFLIPHSKSAGIPIELRVEPGSDPRDALDQGADMLISRDPDLIEYVAGRSEFIATPLPWSRTYVLVRSTEESGELTVDLADSTIRSSLARDAVRASARGAEPPYWWQAETECRATPRTNPGTASNRVVYSKDDDVARRLAERIVALAHTGSGQRAVGLDSISLAKAIGSGSERAYVVGLPRESLVPCRDAWRWPAGAHLLPLIDTRAYAILRKGAPPLTVDWDGTIRVAEP
jgi:hypothetical protein